MTGDDPTLPAEKQFHVCINGVITPATLPEIIEQAERMAGIRSDTDAGMILLLVDAVKRLAADSRSSEREDTEAIKAERPTIAQEFAARCRETRNGSPNAFYALVDAYCKQVEASPPLRASRSPQDQRLEQLIREGLESERHLVTELRKMRDRAEAAEAELADLRTENALHRQQLAQKDRTPHAR